jgi:glycosyltransferase involved in cell wall biosynthesis
MRGGDRGSIFRERRAPVFKSLNEFRDAVAATEYAFLSSGPESHRLGQMRWSTQGDYAITTLIHSVNWFDLMPFYLGLLSTSRPCDSLVATSRAAETAVRAILDWLRENCGVAGDIDVVRIPLGIDLDRVYPGGREHSRSLLGIDASEQVILYVGRLTDEFKADLEPLLGVAKRLVASHPGIRLVLTGQDRDGDGYAVRLRATARAMGLGGQVTVIENPVPRQNDWSTMVMAEARDVASLLRKVHSE